MITLPVLTGTSAADQTVGLYLIDTYAAPWMPKFVYFDDHDAMPGKVSIPNLIRRRDEGTLDRGERALLSLLNMANVTPEDFHADHGSKPA